VALWVWCGVVRGLQTLQQLLLTDSSLAGPPSSVYDVPRFPWRGVLVDTARHFFPVPSLQRLLDGYCSALLNQRPSCFV
jgi:hexosaminidase